MNRWMTAWGGAKAFIARIKINLYSYPSDMEPDHPPTDMDLLRSSPDIRKAILRSKGRHQLRGYVGLSEVTYPSHMPEGAARQMSGKSINYEFV